MTCPCCGKEMEPGYFNGFHVESFYCADCKQILTPVK